MVGNEEEEEKEEQLWSCSFGLRMGELRGGECLERTLSRGLALPCWWGP